jgi:hypothetical protein
VPERRLEVTHDEALAALPCRALQALGIGIGGEPFVSKLGESEGLRLAQTPLRTSVSRASSSARAFRSVQPSASRPRRSLLTTVLVALLGGAGGAVAAKFLEGRFQRSQSLRTWRLAAADEFTTAVPEALIGLRSCRNALYEYGGARVDGNIEIRDPTTNQVKPEIREALDKAEGFVDVAAARLGRVHILFSSGSPTGQAATETIVNLRQAFQALVTGLCPIWPVIRKRLKRRTPSTSTSTQRFSSHLRRIVPDGLTEVALWG